MRKKYNARGFEVLVINTSPPDARDAQTLVRSLNYGFKLLHAPEGWNHSMGRDANYLIDQRGRVIALLHFGGHANLATVNRLVKGLLKYGNQV